EGRVSSRRRPRPASGERARWPVRDAPRGRNARSHFGRPSPQASAHTGMDWEPLEQPRPRSDEVPMLRIVLTRIRRLRQPPTAMAALTMLVGVIDIVSALTPELGARVHEISSVLSLDLQLT